MTPPLRSGRFFRVVAISVSFSLTLVGCHSRQKLTPDGLTPIRVQLDWYPQPEHGGFLAAKLLGYYKEEGLDVTLLPLAQYGSVPQMVATGKADFGLNSSVQILEWDSRGLPLVAVAATMQHDPQAIMVHKDSAVHDFKDLEGHTVAATTGATWVKYVIQHYNLHEVRQVPTTLSISNFLADPDYVQQVFVTAEPFYARQAGADVRTLLISSAGYDPYRVQFTNRDFLAQHPDLVARFVRATIRGWKAYLQDPTATNALLLKLNPALNPAQVAYSAQALRDGGFVAGTDQELDQTGQMSAARWKTNCDQLKALGIVVGTFDPASAYTLDFLPKASQRSAPAISH